MLIGHGVGFRGVWQCGIGIGIVLARRRAQIRLIEIHSKDGAAASICQRDLLHAEVEVGRPIGLEIWVSDEDHAPDRNAFGGGRNDHLGELRRLERRSDRCAYRRVAGRRPNEACARIEAGAKGTEVALIGRDRIMYVARRVAVVAQYRLALRLREWEGLHRQPSCPAASARQASIVVPVGPNGLPIGCASAMTCP